MGNARRGDGDAVLAEPGGKELAGQAAAGIFESDFDARSGTCVATDAVTAFRQESAFGGYGNCGGENAGGVGVEDLDVELESKSVRPFSAFRGA